MKYSLLILTVLGTLQLAVAQPAQIILIRHAEKPADPAALHLSKKGRERAKGLVPFLTNNPVLTQHGAPVALYAAHPTKHGHGQRTQETIAPLAEALHLPVETPYLAEAYAGLAKSILTNPKYLGKTVLICWVHEYIPQFAAVLGVSLTSPIFFRKPSKNRCFTKICSK